MHASVEDSRQLAPNIESAPLHASFARFRFRWLLLADADDDEHDDDNGGGNVDGVVVTDKRKCDALSSNMKHTPRMTASDCYL